MANWKRAKVTLSDRFGPWCAWCLGYIKTRDHLEDHHVLSPKEKIWGKLGFEPPIVPVHRHPWHCHRERLQYFADTAGFKLMQAAELPPVDLDATCKSCHKHGNLPASLLLQHSSLLKAIKAGDVQGARKSLIHTLNSGAGCVLGLALANEIKEKPHLAALIEDIDTQLYYASLKANGGDVTSARTTYEQIDVPRFNGRQSSASAKYVRMMAIVSPDLHLAQESLRLARDSPARWYHTRTSTLALASAHEAKRNYGSARDEAVRLRAGFEKDDASWWHGIEQQFLLGRSTLLRDHGKPSNRSFREALPALIRAQYASAFLGFMGIPVPDFREASTRPSLTNITVTEVIHWAGMSCSISRAEMKEIRCKTLGRGAADGFKWTPGQYQQEVLDALCQGLTALRSSADLNKTRFGE
jgi:hypothetical protein